MAPCHSLGFRVMPPLGFGRFLWVFGVVFPFGVVPLFGFLADGFVLWGGSPFEF